MYQMKAQAKCTGQGQDFVATVKEHTWDKWHCILGHINIWMIKTLQNNQLVTSLSVNKSQEPTQCTACIQRKQHVNSLPKEATETAEKIGDLVLSDVWGPAQIEGPAWEKYFYSFTDAKSWYSMIYFRNTKDEALRNFTMFKEFIETQTGNKLKRFQSNNGGEYINKAFKEFCTQHGLIMETTAPYSLAQNGITEQLNRTLFEHTCTMIFAKNLPKVLWPEVVAYANYINN